MTEGRRFKRRVIFRAAGLGGIVCAGILLFSGRWDMAIGLAVGTWGSILNFHLMATDVFKSLSVRAGKASGVAAGRYFLRYTMLGLLLVVLFTRTNIHAASTLIGLLSVQVVIYGWEIGKTVAGKIMRNEQ
ncbi:MAG: ATP synthase subunit I [Candidatus Latescibacteria bacterium]|nr:ATP synthase subunit I [Candidatus Latescibacterota bacterium]